MPADQAQTFDVIGVRGVLGFFFLALEQFTGQTWMSKICNVFESNQDTETYAGLGMSPQLREWIGKKQAKTLSELSVKITNRDFEATLEIRNKDRRRDKTAQLMARIGDLAERSIAHDAVLLSALIDGGTSTSITIPSGSSVTVACYDGQPMWSASHTIAGQAVNNIISVSISAAATFLGTNIGTGTTANPSPAVMALAINNAIQQLYGFKDDQGQPLNELARSFVVMVPPSLSGSANAAVRGQYLGVGYTNPLLFATAPNMEQTQFLVVPNPRLSSPTPNQFYVFRADGAFKPMIRQVEALKPTANVETAWGQNDQLGAGYGLVMKALAEGSDHEFYNNSALFSVEKSGFVGFGRFDQAVQVVFAT